jgi:hypothetical protein
MYVEFEAECRVVKSQSENKISVGEMIFCCHRLVVTQAVMRFGIKPLEEKNKIAPIVQDDKI